MAIFFTNIDLCLVNKIFFDKKRKFRVKTEFKIINLNKQNNF